MKKFASLLPNHVKLALLRRHLALSVGGNGQLRPTLTIINRPDKISPLRVSLHKGDSGIEVALNIPSALQQPFVYRMLYARLPTVIRIFSRSGPKVRVVTADLSDGGDSSPGGLAFSSWRNDVILIPDPVFVNSGGYAEFRFPLSLPPWSRRRDALIWRGTSTGIGEVTTETMRNNDPSLRQRVRMCLILRSTVGTDVKIRKTEGGGASRVDHDRLVRHGLLGGKIRQANWGRYKFALDIDGHTNAWSNLFVRLLLGCCVLKIKSEYGFRQWYYDGLTPWRHYVPVRSDMSDLIEKLDWCRAHGVECAKIADAGSAFAHAMTVESEIAQAVQRLEANKISNFTISAGTL